MNFRTGRRLAGATAAIALALAPAMPMAQSGVSQPGLAQAGTARSVSTQALDPANPPIQQVPIALIMDADAGTAFFAKDADRRFIPASLTKLMTVYTAFELLEQGRLLPQQRMPVSARTAQEWSGKGSTMFSVANTSLSVDTLLKAILTVSANDGCVILAEGAAGSIEGWTALMNANAEKLGMKDSHFNTPNGWMDEGRTYTSARDLATLTRALLTEHGDLYRRYFALPSFRYNNITQNNRNPILGYVEGADGLKTGFTNEAGYGFVGSAERDGRRLIMVLGGAESSSQRKKVARDFIEWGFAAWDAQRIYGKGEPVGRVDVQGGAVRHVAVAAANPVHVSVPHGQTADVAIKLRYQGPIAAPIRKGQRVGELRVEREGMSTASFDLIATEDVGEANAIQRLRNGLLGLFG